MTENEAPRVVAIGDSLIYGRLDPERGGWIGLTRSWLEQEGPEGTAVFNLGIGGDTSVATYSRATVELPPRTPNAVIVGAGTNDLRRIEGPGGSPEVDPETYANKMRDTLRAARRIGAVIAVAGLIPVDESKTLPHKGELWYTNEDVRHYDSILRAVADGEGALYINFAPAFSRGERSFELVRNELFVDGIHPGPAGHEAMFAVAQPTLRQWLGL